MFALWGVLAIGVGWAAEPAPAPPLEVIHWIAEGPAVDATEALLVVEVWATWCGPCKETMPKLTALQADYGDRIRVVALTDDTARAARAAALIERLGPAKAGS